MLIKNALLVDALGEKKADILIENGIIIKIGKNLNPADSETLDAAGLVAMPAFVDLHCHFRTPGFEYKEDIITGSAAAARGGFTLVNCMANTKPVCSDANIALKNMQAARENGICAVNQAVSITKDFDGKTLEHLYSLPKELKIISDDGKGVQSALTMLLAMQIAREKDLTIFSHAEDMELSATDYRLAEDIETIRNIELAKATGAKLHMSHVSTIGAMQAIMRAKAQGVSVSCEVAPHHIWFTDQYSYRVNPPLRTAADVEFLINAIKSGEVDAIATDHAPHSKQDKQNGAPGMVGLETAFAVCYTKLCEENGLPLPLLSKIMSTRPAEILNSGTRLLREGLSGDIVIADINKIWTVDKSCFASKSQNTPWHGTQLKGKIIATIMGGKITYKEQ